MPAEVVDQVHTLAQRSAAGHGLIFANHDSIPDDDDTSMNPMHLMRTATMVLTTNLSHMMTTMLLTSQE